MKYKVPDEERLLNFKEAQEYLRVSRSTLFRFMRQGKITGHKVGYYWRFYLKDVKKLIYSNDTTEDV